MSAAGWVIGQTDGPGEGAFEGDKDRNLPVLRIDIDMQDFLSKNDFYFQIKL